MAIPYSTQFYAGSVALVGSTTVAATPTNQVGVIRDIEVYNNSSAANFCDFAIGGVVALALFPTLAAGAGAQWKGRLVLKPGQSLVAYGPTSNTFYVFVSGYLLNL